MLPVLLSLWSSPALADAPTADDAFWRLVAAEGADTRTQVAARAERPWTNRRAGGDLLDVYEYGDVVVLIDEDGDFFDEALAKVFTNPTTGLDWFISSMQEAFYDHYEDDYEYLTAVMVRDLGLFFAFYSPLANDVGGLGYSHFAGVDRFDQSIDTDLEGFIFMNSLGLWQRSPEAGRMTFGQEFMHRWGSFVQVSHASLGANDLLGRDTAHWSYWLDTPNSPMEGNDWVDGGDGTFTTHKATHATYSPLDLYLMGLVPPSDVPDFTLLQVDEAEQSRVGRTPASAPEAFNDVVSGDGVDITVTATPVPVSLADIVAVEGARSPSSTTSPKEHRMAFLVLVLEGDVFDEDTLQDVDDLRAKWESDWETDVGGRADLITTLGPGTAPRFGAEPGDTSDTGEGGKACGCAAGTGGGATGGWALLALLLLRRRRG